METVSWMTDYLTVRMLGLALAAERRFEDCLIACPRRGDTIVLDDPAVFARLVDLRLNSLVLSLAALESYLAAYAASAGEAIAAEDPKATLNAVFETKKLREQVQGQPNRLRRRFEYFQELFGDKPIRRFLSAGELTLEEKLLFWPLVRTGRLLSLKDGHMKKLVRIISLHDELLTPDFANAPELGRARTREELTEVFLHHPVPPSLTLGLSLSDRYVVETYAEGHFIWELLHVYPARAVKEAIQLLHQLDGTVPHFLTVAYAVEVETGRPAKEYKIEVNLGGADEPEG
jgi:hypothetical protein